MQLEVRHPEGLQSRRISRAASWWPPVSVSAPRWMLRKQQHDCRTGMKLEADVTRYYLAERVGFTNSESIPLAAVRTCAVGNLSGRAGP